GLRAAIRVDAPERLRDLVEHAVHEGARLFAPELLRELHRFVEDDGARHFGLVNELPRSEPQQVAIDARHALDTPVRRRFRDARLPCRELLADTAPRSLRVLTPLGLRLEASPEKADHFLGTHARCLHLEEHLQRSFTARTSCAHRLLALRSELRRVE